MSKLKYHHIPFKNFTTEKEWYWLGYLYADGCMSSGNSHAVVLYSSGKDASHIQKYADFCQRNLKHRSRFDKRTKKIYTECSVGMYNKECYTKLFTMGLIPNKSTVKSSIPNILPDMIHHFIRGYFDGDGHVGIRLVNGSKQLRFQLTNGHPSLLEEIAIIMRPIVNVKFKIAKSSNANCYIVSCAGNNVCRRIYHYLYKDATVYMERKKIIFEQISDSRKPQPRNMRLSKNEIKQIKQLLTTGLTQGKIAHEYNITQDMVSSIKMGKNWYIKK